MNLGIPISPILYNSDFPQSSEMGLFCQANANGLEIHSRPGLLMKRNEAYFILPSCPSILHGSGFYQS